MGSLGGRHIIPTAQHCSVQPDTAKPQNAALGAGLQIPVPCRFLRGCPPGCHPALLCQGWWLGWSLWGWHLQVRYHRVKSTMGKCLVDF